jgi:hypothetical protein
MTSARVTWHTHDGEPVVRLRLADGVMRMGHFAAGDVSGDPVAAVAVRQASAWTGVATIYEEPVAAKTGCATLEEALAWACKTLEHWPTCTV